MTMKPVSSSQIHSLGYDTLSRTMAVKFHSGGTYHYHDVPMHVHNTVATAASIGVAFHKHVKSAGYRHTKHS